MLGLITTKHGELEPVDGLIERIHQAARLVPLERLAISPQCGFATSIMGNNLSIEQQNAKLKLLTDVAGRVWG